MMKLFLGVVAWPLHWVTEGARKNPTSMRLLIVFNGPMLVAGALSASFDIWQPVLAAYLWIGIIGFLLLWESRPEPAVA